MTAVSGDRQVTTLHGPTELTEDVREALERAGWTVTSITNGGPVAHITVQGDWPDVELLTGSRFGYRIEPAG